ncbi:MAG: PspC family transcriptional regulator [Saprospiraceae bacterium]
MEKHGTFIEKNIKPIIEKYSFGVCRYIAEKWGLNESKVRLYFIYTSFVAIGSPVIFYLFIAFWINIKKYVRSHITL